MGREVFDPNPGQDQESGVVDHQRQIAAADLGVPSRKLRRDLLGCGAEAKDGEGFTAGGADAARFLTHDAAHEFGTSSCDNGIVRRLDRPPGRSANRHLRELAP